MTRNDFKELSRLRRKEAKILLDSNQYSGAYYLSGYTLECALKACIAKTYTKHVFPDKGKVIKSHTHNLEALLKIASLDYQFEVDSADNQDLRANWATAKDWSESSRYQIISQIDAQDLYLAISNQNNGILSWIQQYW